MASALQWRSSCPGRPAQCTRQPHSVRSCSRSGVKVFAIFVNPHQILGVSDVADVKEVKRAYRKLALQYHPDVCKTQDGHDRFLALTQAYEMLLGRAEGKSDSHHASSSASSGGWDFHDWYWSFRMQRSWAKQQQGRSAAASECGENAERDGEGASADGPTGQSRPHQAAGFKQPEAREALRSQLAGLRHRAAVRAQRPASPPPAARDYAAAAAAADESPYSATSSEAQRPAQDVASSPAPVPPSPYATGRAARAHASSGGPMGHSPAGASSGTTGPGARGPQWAWSWSESLEVDEEEEALLDRLYVAHMMGRREKGDDTAAQEGRVGHVEEELGGQGQSMALHDGHFATALNHAVPFPAGRGRAGSASAAAVASAHSVGSGAESAAAQADTAALLRNYHCDGPADGHAHHADPEPEPFSSPFAGQGAAAGGGRRRFVAHGEVREAVGQQLAGLRRKAALRTTL